MGAEVLPKSLQFHDQHIQALGLHISSGSASCLIAARRVVASFLDRHCPGRREYEECLAACPASLAPAFVSEMHRRADALVANAMHSLRR